jgi:hypothetical protein
LKDLEPVLVWDSERISGVVLSRQALVLASESELASRKGLATDLVWPLDPGWVWGLALPPEWELALLLDPALAMDLASASETRKDPVWG